MPQIRIETLSGVEVSLSAGLDDGVEVGFVLNYEEMEKLYDAVSAAWNVMNSDDVDITVEVE